MLGYKNTCMDVFKSLCFGLSMSLMLMVSEAVSSVSSWSDSWSVSGMVWSAGRAACGRVASTASAVVKDRYVQATSAVLIGSALYSCATHKTSALQVGGYMVGAACLALRYVHCVNKSGHTETHERLKRVEAQGEQVKKALEGLRVSVDRVEGRVETIGKDVLNVQALINAMQKDLTAARQDIANVGGQVEVVGKDVAAVRQDVVAVRQDVVAGFASTKARLDQQQQALGEIRQQSVEHEAADTARYASLERQIKDLSTQLQTVVTMLAEERTAAQTERYKAEKRQEELRTRLVEMASAKRGMQGLMDVTYMVQQNMV